MSSDWLRVDLLLSEISDSTGLFGVVCKTNKLAPQMFIHDKMLLSYLTVLFLINVHIFDYSDPRSPGLFHLVPTSPHNQGSTILYTKRPKHASLNES